MHLLIPFAASPGGMRLNDAEGLQLPNLQALLNRLQPLPLVALGEASLSPPHEHALANVLWGPAQSDVLPNLRDGLLPKFRDGLLLDLQDGLLPWAARQAAQAGLAGLAGSKGPADAAWAFITPCHWSVQSQHITLDDPAALQLTEAESMALLAAMQPYFAQDGIALFYQTPTCWLAQGAVFAGLPTASLDRAINRDIQTLIPKSAAAKGLRRLQQEMQMLLYTLPLTDERTARGLPVVNSFWISGTGSLPKSVGANAQVIAPQGLREAHLKGDEATWMAAWREMDSTHCATLLAALAQDGRVTLTLCGERAYQNFKPFENGFDRFYNQIKRKIRPLFPSNIISLL